MKMKKLFFLISFCLFYGFSFSQEPDPLIINTFNRNSLELDGKWHYIIDPQQTGYYDYRRQPYDQSENPGSGAYFTNVKPTAKTDRIEYSFDYAPTLQVPGDWNSQDEKLMFYEGSIWYQRYFNHQKQADKRFFLYFGAVNYDAHVYLNGKKVGEHQGGFTPFNFEVTDLVKEGENFVVLKVDNTRKPEYVPTIAADWWNYGGITRSVRLIQVPQTFIRDYKVQLKKGSEYVVEGYVQLDGEKMSNSQVKVSIPEINLSKEFMTNEEGVAEFTFQAQDLTLWDLENPKLYQVLLQGTRDEVTEKIGFRSIEVRGTDILLNGEPVFLRGVCLHEENPIRGGRAYTESDARLLYNWVEEMNGNFVRLAHYPHNEYMPRIADELGILLWEEIPVYWTIEWENPATLEAAQSQLGELITRDKNRASVIIWSVANETPVSEPRNRFLRSLVETARSYDDTRLVSAALERHEKDGKQTVDDPFGQYTDILSFNQYFGWYGGDPKDFPDLEWDIRYDKPVVISEFGAGALFGFHGDSLTVWSEEHQAYVYDYTMKGLKNVPYLSGLTPWILADFRSPRRPLANIQDFYNRKGLISSTGQKKAAFYVLQKYYRQRKEGR